MPPPQSLDAVEVCDWVEGPRTADEVAFDILCHARWPDGFVCACGCAEATWLEKREVWQCHDCRRQTSLTSGTAFAHSKLALSEILFVGDGVRQGLSAREIERRLATRSYEAVWSAAHKIRRALHRVLPDRDEPHDSLVEIVVPVEVVRGAPAMVRLTMAVTGRGLLAAWVDRAAAASTSPWLAADVCARLFRWLMRVFRGVSRKFLRRYIEAYCAARNGVDCLRAAMTAPHCSVALMRRFP